MAVSYQARNRGAWLGSGWALLATLGVMGDVAVENDAEQRVLERTTGLTTSLGFKPILMVWQIIAYPAVVYAALAVLALVLWRKLPQELIFKGVLACASTWAASTVIKLIVERQRPPEALTHASNFSFPSGHAANTMAAAVIAATWLAAAFGARTRWAVIGGLVFVALTCCDRLLLGVHYPTDVAAGVLLGLLVPAHFRFALNDLKDDEARPRPTAHEANQQARSTTDSM